MDEATYVGLMMKEFHDMAKADPDASFDELVDRYLDEGYDLEGYESYAYKGYRLAHE